MQTQRELAQIQASTFPTFSNGKTHVIIPHVGARDERQGAGNFYQSPFAPKSLVLIAQPSSANRSAHKERSNRANLRANAMKQTPPRAKREGWTLVVNRSSIKKVAGELGYKPREQLNVTSPRTSCKKCKPSRSDMVRMAGKTRMVSGKR